MKQKTGRKLLSFLLTLAMLVGLMPGMSLTAYAATSHGITINTAQHGTVTASVNGSAATSAEEGATVTLTANPDNGYRLKSISGTYKGNPQETKGLNGTKTINGTYFNLNATDAAGLGWKLANNSTITITSKDTSVKIDKVDFNISQRGRSFDLNYVSCSAGTKSLNGNTLSVSSINGTTVTLSSSANNVRYVRFNSVTIYGTGTVDTNLTISTAGDVNVRTFTMPTVVQGDVTITPVFEEIPKYNVTLNGGANAITSGGNTTQTGVTGAMTTVTYTANSGYHFTEFANITNNGITATRTSDTVVAVSGTPTADASITIPDAVADAVAVTGVTLNPSAAQTIDVDGTVSFTATVLPDNATDKSVKWSVGGTDTGAVKLYSDEACTTEVGADATDKLTVYAKGISAGSATITATSNADSEKKASCDVTVNAAQTQTEELLTTITAVGASNASTATSANVSYSTEDIATLTFSQVTPDGYGRVSYVPTWGWWGYGITLTVTPADGYTITKCVFYDDANRTATDSEAPFVVETAEEGDKAPKVNGTPILAYTSKGIKKIEVYGYATPTATHSVTITPGDNMTKTAGSGDAEQTGLTGAMTDVVYTANEGYYFPENYSVAKVNGISVTRDSYTQITVSGTPTADASITLTAPTAKTTPDAPTAAATDCTTTDNNDGKLTGVTTEMEYKKSDAENWTAGTGSDITGLVPGTYYVRVKATDTTNASAYQELTIAEYTAPTYTVTYKVVNGTWSDDSTADKTENVQSGSKPASVPTGMKAASGYTGGAWDTDPADATITGATTFTYTFTALPTYEVTYKVVNGTWSDDSTTDKTETVQSGSKPASVPTGMKAASGYTGGSWDNDPTDATITGATTFTYTFTAIPTYEVTYKVVNGTWSDDSTTDKTETVQSGSKPASVPTGMKAASGYTGGSWDNDPTDATITGATTFTYTFTAIPTYEVTYKVVNGTWSDDSTTDKTETVQSGSKPASVPTGMKAASGYTGGSWDNDPAEATITGATTFTYTFTAKQAATVTKAPEAKTLTYTGSAQELVTSGTATGGTMQYALGTATEATQPYTTSIPTATEAGTYYVWYKVVGDANHLDSEAKPVEAAIGSVDSNTAAPTELTLTYDGSGQPLVKPGSVDYGTLFYALGSNDTTAPTDGWSTEAPTATKAGTYYVWYKVVGDANHNDVEPACVVVTIAEAAKSETPAEQPAEQPAASTSDYTLLATLKTSGKKAFKMGWTAVPGAEGYDIFFGMCNKGDCQLVASVNGTSYKIKGLKKGFAYKAYVRAWKNVGGAKVYIGEPSPDVHAITNGKSNRYTNPKKISVKKKKLTVGVGKTKAIKAKLKKFSDSREYLNHVSAKVRYYSSDRAVATVSANGRVTGVGPGKCTVFVVAENGLRVGVKVTVK